MRKVNTWTRRSTEAWSGHSSSWLRWCQTSSSRYVCALVFKCLQGLRIGKQSSAYQILASHSWLWPLVLCVFFFDASWFFRREFCRVSVG
jgi:hypothetical protein